MLKCPNCGANYNGLECEYCGAKATPSTAMPNQYFIDNFMKEHKAFSEKSEEEKMAIREKNRLARVAIGNGKCPDCGTPFQLLGGFALSASCKKCGASIYEMTYLDKF